MPLHATERSNIPISQLPLASLQLGVSQSTDLSTSTNQKYLSLHQRKTRFSPSTTYQPPYYVKKTDMKKCIVSLAHALRLSFLTDLVRQKLRMKNPCGVKFKRCARLCCCRQCKSARQRTVRPGWRRSERVAMLKSLTLSKFESS